MLEILVYSLTNINKILSDCDYSPTASDLAKLQGTCPHKKWDYFFQSNYANRSVPPSVHPSIDPSICLSGYTHPPPPIWTLVPHRCPLTSIVCFLFQHPAWSCGITLIPGSSYGFDVSYQSSMSNVNPNVRSGAYATLKTLQKPTSPTAEYVYKPSFMEGKFTGVGVKGKICIYLCVCLFVFSVCLSCECILSLRI